MKKLLLGMAALAALFTGACCRESGNSPTVTGATPRSAQVKLSDTVTQYMAGAAYKGEAYEIDFT